MTTPPAIEADGLVKHFGETVAVDGVSFSVPEGTVLGMRGPNGAGQTTTVRMMTTLTPPTSATARVAGHDILRSEESRVGQACVSPRRPRWSAYYSKKHHSQQSKPYHPTTKK